MILTTRAVWLTAGSLGLFAVVAYLGSFGVPFLFDDGPSIVHNPTIRRLWPLTDVVNPKGVDGGATVSGRPLVNLSLALNYAVGGQQVWGYHAFNLAVHVTAGLLLFGVVRRTLLLPAMAARWGDRALPFAWAVAALWLLHPLQTAAVTYVVQRAEAMAGLWYLLALYAFIRTEEPARRVRWLVLSVAACLAGVASKEVAATAPLAILLYDRAFVAGSLREAWRQRWGYYAALAGSWLLLAWLVLGTSGRGGTAGFGLGAVTTWTYALTQCDAILRYLRLVVWPHPLVFDYGTATVSGLGEVAGQAVMLAALLVGAVWLLIRCPKAGFVTAWWFILLAPSSSIVPVATQTMAEHRVYLALAGPVVLAVWGLVAALGRWHWLAAGALALAAGSATVARNSDYATARSLWADTVTKRPNNPRAHHNLGLAEQAAGRLEVAEQHLRDAIALAPGTPEPLYNLGVVLAAMQRPAEATAAYREAIRLAPQSAAAHNNLANLLLAEGRSAEAGWHYAEAVRLQPDFAGFRNSYGAWLLDEGHPAEALTQLEAGLRLQPNLAELSFNAGNAAAALGRAEVAERYYRQVLRLEPGHAEAHNNLGNLLLELDRLPEALAEFETAVRLRADYFEPRRTLAFLLLMHLGRPAEALEHLERLARLRPDDPEIAQALARAREAVP